jgi:WD40 repeat protein
VFSVRSVDGGIIAAALSDGRVKIHAAVSLAVLGVIPAPSEGACVRDLCFSDTAAWVTYSTGVVVEWLITGGVAGRAFIASLPFVKGVRPLDANAADADERGPFSIALNSGGDLLAVGYEEHILFYDLRGYGGTGGLGAPPSCLACYSSSHSGPVVQLVWHPHIPCHLMSGSDDGLVCVFDTSIRGEDDALVAVLNAESGVARFGVFGPQGAFAFVLTRTDTLSLWGLAATERVADFGDLKGALLAASGVRADYLLDCWFCDATGRLVLLVGDHDGRLWALDVTPGGAALLGSLSGAKGAAAHSSTVRTAVLSQLFSVPSGATGGGDESPGIVCWTAGEDGQLVEWANASAEAMLGTPSVASAPATAGSGTAVMRHAPSWKLSSAPLDGLRAAASAHRRGGSASEAATFGQRAARPISPPAAGALASSDLLDIIQ